MEAKKRLFEYFKIRNSLPICEEFIPILNSRN